MGVKDGEGDKEFFRAFQTWTSPEKMKTINVDYYTEKEKTKIKLFCSWNSRISIHRKRENIFCRFLSSRHGNCAKECRLWGV